ncbi:glutamate 5-kinase [Pseudovirgaria hyperparasitica]|uniref:Glutamate 5-kinase n=1 Tax=Pseudovirgaria hyperparasitica TaxID=470096 RepID=A0A6A6WLV5_9PEZI|nr:glutamate 5-kinase [Pseudovirgaria hyperparasitica]KAF2762999.1 glutamate 5-kinase [Pseudovirgaria hyperparasitica]
MQQTFDDSICGTQTSRNHQKINRVPFCVLRVPNKMSLTAQRHLTIVIKLGTSSIVDEKTHEPLLSTLSVIAETAAKLQRDGHKVIIVSSGAIGVALRLMNLERRPKHLPQVQALAAIGQCKLMTMWDQLFAHLRQPVAQILLTRNDIADRTQYLNAQNTFHELLHMGVIPIVNENDTLAVSEIKFGDNDTLSAITAGMVSADYLFLMTDVDCLYDKNPRTHPDARAIEVVKDIAELSADVSSSGSSLGTGGMSTKIVAARLATSAGVTTIITKSSKPGNITNIVKYIEARKSLPVPISRAASSSALSGLSADEVSHKAAATALDGVALRDSTAAENDIPRAPLHTRFLPQAQPMRDRYFWLLHGLTPHGTLYIDEGAYKALSEKAGLLPVGVVDVEGHFSQQEAVRLVVVQRVMPTSPRRGPVHSALGGVSGGHAAYEHENPAPREVGRALVNYASSEIKLIQGLRSREIRNVLGYADSEYVCLRENIAFTDVARSTPASPPLDGRRSVDLNGSVELDRGLASLS